MTRDHPGGWGLQAGEGRGGPGWPGGGPGGKTAAWAGALSALWYGGGGGVGGAPRHHPACLQAYAQSFHSFLMVRFHSQDR